MPTTCELFSCETGKDVRSFWCIAFLTIEDGSRWISDSPLGVFLLPRGGGEEENAGDFILSHCNARDETSAFR